MLFTDVSHECVVAAFKKAGFWVSRTSGKHSGTTDGKRKITSPRRNKPNPYTLKGIIRDAGLTYENFKKML